MLPTTILYDAQGREVWRYVGDLDWTGEEAAKLLDEAGVGPGQAEQPPVDRGEAERDQAEPDEVVRRRCSPRNSPPSRIATGGTSRVTSSALVAPAKSISRK